MTTQHALAIIGQGNRPMLPRHITLAPLNGPPRIAPTTTKLRKRHIAMASDDAVFLDREIATDELFRRGFYTPQITIERGEHIDDRMEEYLERRDDLPSRLIVDVTAVKDMEYDRQWTPELFVFDDFSVELIEYHRRPKDDGRLIAVYHVQPK